MSPVLGQLSEEFGSRGFALDCLQVIRSPLVSSLVLGVFGLLWHAPEFFMKGIPIGDMISWLAPFLMFAANVLAMSVLYT